MDNLKVISRRRSVPAQSERRSRALQIAAAIFALLLLVVLGAGVAWYEPDRSVAALSARWAPPPSRFVEVAGLQVHLRDEGPRDDPAPILLLHGTSASLHTWEGWAAALRERRRVLRFDLPGFGLTGPAADGDYSLEAYVRTVIAVADALGLQGFVLGGNSLGGQVAWATAVLHPARVQRLILVDAAGYPVRAESVPLGFRLAATPLAARVIESVLPRFVVEDSVREVYGDPSKVTPVLVDRYFELTTRAGNRAALVARLAGMRSDGLVGRIPEIDVPTLILWGRRDRLIPLASGERFAREIRGSRLVVFDALGHVPHEEDPAATVAVVEPFLQRP